MILQISYCQYTTTVVELPDDWNMGNVTWSIGKLNPNLNQSVLDVNEIQMVFHFVENTNPFQQ